MKKDILRNGAQKQAGIVILISNKADHKPKLVRRDKESHFTYTEGIIHQEEIIIVNI
jgi:hypothetical protein